VAAEDTRWPQGDFSRASARSLFGIDGKTVARFARDMPPRTPR